MKHWRETGDIMNKEQIRVINNAMSSLTTIWGDYIPESKLDKFIKHHTDAMNEARVPKDIVEHYRDIARKVPR